jgi:chorismate mutase
MRFGKQIGLPCGPRAASDARRSKGEDRAMDETLARYRESIDNIDAALVFLLAERFKITQAVGQYKAQAALPPADPAREGKQVARLRRLAVEANLDPDFTEKFLRFIIDEVIRHHERMRGND